VRTRGLALAALLPLAAGVTAACGTTAPSAGGAYGTTVAAATSSAATSSASASGAASASASGATTSAAKTTLTVRKTGIGYVLATSTGRTVYWYSDDVRNSGHSSCSAGCLTAWPAVTGTPVVAAGVQLSDKLGTITRSGGVIQATYNGYPLYTYGGDLSAGETSGNGVGGVWHVITGAALSPSPASAAAASARDKPGGSTGSSSSPSASASASTKTGGGY
jgi:predicted lipoprotein with Yx(FWY)xxD motif